MLHARISRRRNKEVRVMTITLKRSWNDRGTDLIGSLTPDRPDQKLFAILRALKLQLYRFMLADDISKLSLGL
jgi:hypothetical protein